MNPTIKNILLGILGVLLLMFVAIYIVSLSGYYDTALEDKKTLTSEAMDRFEKDVLNGKVIVASNYVEDLPTYDNLLSRMGIKIGNMIEVIFKKVINSILKEIEVDIE